MSNHERSRSIVVASCRHTPDFASDRLFRRHVEFFILLVSAPGENERLSMGDRERSQSPTGDCDRERSQSPLGDYGRLRAITGDRP